MYTLLLADSIAIMHLGYVTFVVLGFVLIVLGVIFQWRWIRNLWFRIIHLLAVVAVAGEALLGLDCPLTVLEFRLRFGAHRSGEEISFIGVIIDSLLFYDAPAWVFTLVYAGFGVLVAATFILAPPIGRGHSRSS